MPTCFAFLVVLTVFGLPIVVSRNWNVCCVQVGRVLGRRTVSIPRRETVPSLNPSADPRVVTRDVVNDKLVQRITPVLVKPVDPRSLNVNASIQASPLHVPRYASVAVTRVIHMIAVVEAQSTSSRVLNNQVGEWILELSHV